MLGHFEEELDFDKVAEAEEEVASVVVFSQLSQLSRELIQTLNRSKIRVIYRFVSEELKKAPADFVMGFGVEFKIKELDQFNHKRNPAE